MTLSLVYIRFASYILCPRHILETHILGSISNTGINYLLMLLYYLLLCFGNIPRDKRRLYKNKCHTFMLTFHKLSKSGQRYDWLLFILQNKMFSDISRNGYQPCILLYVIHMKEIYHLWVKKWPQNTILLLFTWYDTQFNL